jgi:hypothetical protein
MRLLVDTYSTTTGLIENAANSVMLNTTINTTELHRNYSFATITLHDSLYDVISIAQDFADTGLGDWFSEATPMGTKVTYLDSHGLYEDLRITQELEPGQEVISFEISKDISGMRGNYIPMKDFVFTGNKLYVFNE